MPGWREVEMKQKKARVLRVSSGTAKYDGKRRHYVNWLFKNISVSYLSGPGI